MKSIVSLIFEVALCFLLNSNGDAKELSSSNLCRMPTAEFKFSYMDSFIRQAPKPSDAQFINGVSGKMDAAKEEMYLWYLLSHPNLVDDFFKKVKFAKIIEKNEDSLNSIVWIMVHTEGFLPKKIKENNMDAINKLESWRANYKVKNLARSLVIDLYANKNYSSKDFAEMQIPANDEDVDLTLRLGVINEKNNRGLESLFYYTKAAEFGYQGGLVGAALRLSAEGGHDCLQRAAYYILLSGATDTATWWTRN